MNFPRETPGRKENEVHWSDEPDEVPTVGLWTTEVGGPLREKKRGFKLGNKTPEVQKEKEPNKK